MATKKPENMTFEASIDELDTIVAQLENGELSLDDALKSFERGISLARASQNKLTDAEQRVSILMGDAENATLADFKVEDES
jgi:exodeoxyribonuclease VII small subunit